MARATSEGRISPRPTAANTSSIEVRASRGSAPVQLLVGIFALGALAEPLDDAAAEPGVLHPHRVARGAADRGRALPVTTIDSQAAGGAVCAFEVEDLDLVAVVELGHERGDLAVDLAADRTVADVGVHGIGEVDRRRLARQRDQLALRA